ncbi:MAG: N-acetylmuramoyl-L-alanine amidase [Zymomonas mobilis subsp. pomaceae]|uniref:N-acetylmuramoyl-L-alanine amidase family protein n=1 Tax=Zymomonas mobilis TaxID=542 RepID=UPI0027D993CB|nr:N-acetylmuramoyl-L-alanine amidase [Zymomonas mobilis]MDX5949240.1 N-acetylmuramoyl-L-alanine amidase [Zymomonas mobilis subsp. pomaceae]
MLLAKGTTTSQAVRIPLAHAVTSDKISPKIYKGRVSGRPLVVIDPGHGGHDPGSSSRDGRLHEKNVTLAIALAVRNALRESGRVSVVLTREDDHFLPLVSRREMSRRMKADLFISIHADSAPSGNPHGATIYTLSEIASDKIAANLAARENQADLSGITDIQTQNNDVKSILYDLTRRETMNASVSFASLLQRELQGRIPFRSHYHRFAGFVVLKAPDVPSVLIETGYISNPDEAAQLFSRSYRQAIASGIRRAVEIYFARRLAHLAESSNFEKPKSERKSSTRSLDSVLKNLNKHNE